MADQVWAHVNAHRREFLAANGGKAFSFSFLPSTLNAYLNPLNISISGVWPYVQLPTTLPKIIGSATFDQTYPTSSIPATMPVLFLLGLGGLAATLRRRPLGRLAEARFLLIPAVIGCAGVLLWGYIANRYMADFMPLVIVAASIGLIVACRWLEGRSRRMRRGLLGGFAALCFLGMLVNAALASKVTVTSKLPYFAPAGELFASPSCDGLYRSNGESFSDVPGQQLMHLTLSPVEQGPSLVHRLWITPNVPTSKMKGDTVLFKAGRTRVVVRPVYHAGIGFFLVNPSHPDIRFPGPGGGLFSVLPGHTYAVQIIHDPNIKSIQVWWYNKSFRRLGIPVIDHVQEGRRSGHVVLTASSHDPNPEVGVRQGPPTWNSTKICRQLTAGQHEIAEADFFIDTAIQQTLVYCLIPSA